MSRIEQALEKAVRMRETVKTGFTGKTVALPQQAEAPQFIVEETAIDYAGADKHIVCLAEPNSLAAEQYSKLKARLINATTKDFRNTIMVTSSDIGEGKSTTALNLAITMAREIDYTVLLVDADLRNPSIHRYLGIEPQYGLSDYLKGDVDLSRVLIKTGIGKLVLLPAGTPPANPAELLSAERMKSLIKELKERYRDRYIFFDVPPILTTSDTLSLGGSMDGVIFVINEARSPKKTVTQAVSLMKGWPVLGVVFNNVPQYLIKGSYSRYYSSAMTSAPRSNKGSKHDAKTK